ncbi:hypothetical protein P7K49_035825 [Saguinus oedipus]|uniref:Uncharacterized protein n=1 Tax=Saguinus oedipus TaxID=9490 RepID=A0ABQ9TPE7_SAGOE|nr:hypothetical protein P7K49_035825 [Saguinus oedipus]
MQMATALFSSVAGTPEIQEIKAAAELRSRLRTVSEAGGQGLNCGPASLPITAQAEDSMGVCFFAPQLAEVLSRCSQNIMETQESLSSLRLELVKSRDQVHEERRLRIRGPILLDEGSGSEARSQLPHLLPACSWRASSFN